MRVKRPHCLFFSVEDQDVFDVERFLRGELKISKETQVVALSILSGEGLPVSDEQLRFLVRVPADRFSDVDDLLAAAPEARPWLEEMLQKGLLVSDDSDFRRRDELIESLPWSRYGAFYYFMVRSEMRALLDPEEQVDISLIPEVTSQKIARYVESFGEPPPAFHHREDATRTVELPLTEPQGQLYDLLTRRRTTRVFDDQASLGLEDFSTILRYAFGCHAVARLDDKFVTLGKGSPSGGSLHPVEVYPLVVRVEGVEPGLYHYDAEGHALEELRSLDPRAATELATEITVAQPFAGSCPVFFLITARFHRNFWKYRKRAKAFGITLMDAAHLSQSFYLVATDLGLGAFFTAALDDEALEGALGLEPAEEGAIAVCGCGVKAKIGERLELPFERFVPRRG